jgi:uncharacterized protein (TIGR00725 family)
VTVRAQIAVVGSGDAEATELDAAFAVGRELARHNVVVVTGGHGGVMEAASRGAREGGGLTLGILPGVAREDANAFVDVAVPTGMGELRNGFVVRAADAVIAVGGEFGTLTELAFALKLGKPVIGLDTWELARAGQPVEAIVRVSDPVQAVERALALATSSAL